jgi:hypothetical protein
MRQDGEVSSWRQYQEDAASYFRSVGLDAQTDVELQGVRSTHRIDVVVRFRRAGIDQLWIVECKQHNRRVSKDRPLLLRQIVDDVGADRGILLAERGFQSGAYEVVRSTNTLVTSVAELRESAADEILDVALLGLSRRVREAQKHISRLTVRLSPNSSKLPVMAAESWPGGILGLLGSLAVLEHGVQQAQERDFPAPYGYAEDDRALLASRGDFVPRASAILAEIEDRVTGLRSPAMPG